LASSGAAIGRHDLGVWWQERRRNTDGPVQQAARIITQIENEALQIAVLVYRVQVFGQIGNGGFLKLRDAHPGVARFDDFRFDALHLDDFAHQGEFQRLGFTLAQDAQLDRGLRLAAHLLDRIGQAEALDRCFIELEDQIACFDACPIGWRVLNRRDDLDQAIFHTHFDAQAAEFALGADLQILECIGIEIGGVGVEVGQHAGDGIGDHFFVINRLDIALLDGAVDLGKGAQILDRQAVWGILFGKGRQLQGD
jgi:hypothetical protein